MPTKSRPRLGSSLPKREELHELAGSRHDVIIVGCGPVGAFAAAILARYGVDVVVLERSADVYHAPRAVAVDDETMRLLGNASPALASWFAAHVLRCAIDVRSGPPPQPADAACLPCAPAPSFRASVSLVGPSQPRPVAESGGYPDASFFHQPALEEALRAAAFAPGSSARLCTRVEVTAVGSSSIGSASVTARDMEAGEDSPGIVLRSRYLFGADGGASFVRRALGIPFEGESYPDEPWLVVDVETSDADIIARWQAFNFICDPARPFVHVPLPGPRCGRRFEFLLNRWEDAEAMTSPSSIATILASIHVDVNAVRVVRATVYTFHARQARTWRHGNVVLLGDAAHCLPPFRGQGMCAGMRDAANLCWKVATALSLPVDCSGVKTLLRSYQTERQAHLRAVLAITLAMGQLIMLRSPPLAAVRNLVFSVLNAIPVTSGLMKMPFAPPKACNEGLLDFHDNAGRRSWRTAGHGAAVLPGWVARDRVTGRAIPNVAVEWSGALAGLLDAALWGVATGQGPRRPLWVLLLSPAFTRAGQSHPLCALSPHDWAELVGGDAGPALAVVQVLPGAGSAATIAAHKRSVAGRSGSAGAHLLSVGGASSPWFGRVHACVADSTTALQLWLDASHASAVLVRPDSVVYGAYAREELEGALAHVRSMLAEPDGLCVKKRPSYLPQRIKSGLSLALVVLLIAFVGFAWFGATDGQSRV